MTGSGMDKSDIEKLTADLKRYEVSSTKSRRTMDVCKLDTSSLIESITPSFAKLTQESFEKAKSFVELEIKKHLPVRDMPNVKCYQDYR